MEILENPMSETLDIFYSWGVPRGKQTKKAQKNSIKFIREELKELQEAVDAKDRVAMLDACADILVITLDFAYRNELPIEEGLAMVNMSNMTKTLIGDELDNCQDSIDALAAKGYEGLRVVRADYTGFEDALETGSIIDKDNKVRKPLKFVEPYLKLLIEDDKELRRQALAELTQLSQDNGDYS